MKLKLVCSSLSPLKTHTYLRRTSILAILMCNRAAIIGFYISWFWWRHFCVHNKVWWFPGLKTCCCAAIKSLLCQMLWRGQSSLGTQKPDRKMYKSVLILYLSLCCIYRACSSSSSMVLAAKRWVLKTFYEISIRERPLSPILSRAFWFLLLSPLHSCNYKSLLYSVRVCGHQLRISLVDWVRVF